jgi:hypothetical protein
VCRYIQNNGSPLFGIGNGKRNRLAFLLPRLSEPLHYSPIMSGLVPLAYDLTLSRLRGACQAFDTLIFCDLHHINRQGEIHKAHGLEIVKGESL